MVNVRALDLAHRDEVVRQQLSVVCSHTAHLCQTLVSEESKLLAGKLQLLGLVSEHKLEGNFFVGRNGVSPSNDLVL